MFRRFVFALAIPLALAVASPPVFSQTVYVSNICGDNANSGTLDEPLETIAGAFALPEIPQQICVLPSGLMPYERTTIPMGLEPESGGVLEIVAVGGPSETISEGFVVSQDTAVKIVGFTISFSGDGVVLEGDSADGGIHEVTLTNLVIVDCTLNGIYIGYESTQDFFRVNNCTIWGNGEAGIEIDIFDGFSVDPFASGTIQDCIIGENGNSGVYARGCQNGTGLVTLRHNCFYGNLPGPINCSNDQLFEIDRVTLLEAPCFVAPSLGVFTMDPLCDGPALRDRGSITRLDPDGSRNDLGAYGGPDATTFFECETVGPQITAIFVDSCEDPDEITIHVFGRAGQ